MRRRALHEHIGKFVARFLFHGIEPGDPLDGAPGDDRPIAFEDIHKLAANSIRLRPPGAGDGRGSSSGR